MTQFIQGGANPAAQGVPDLYVQVNAPPAAALPGAPANLIGMVGTATWGPVNSPVVFGDLAGAVAAFGAIQNRKYDLVTHVAAAALQGANAFVGVRVTDGTDVAASATIQTTCLTLTAKYTGTRGNLIQWTIATGSAPSSSKLTLTMPGMQPETYDNLVGAGNALWVAAAAAINNGQGPFRPKSDLCTATAGAGTAAPTNATGSLTAGTDGATTITSTVLLGSDTTPRSGMYALRNTGIALLDLCDADASTSWSTQIAFAKTELCYAVGCSPAGDTIAGFATAMGTAAIDDPWGKVILGDWPLLNDTINNLVRAVSPQAYFVGVKSVAGPHRSGLNRPLAGLVGTQKSAANQTYSTAELQSLAASRGDVIMAPSVGGAYFSFRMGRNSSSDPGKHGDNWTTMTNYLAKSFGQGLGQFVGRLITADETREAKSAIGAFLEAERQAGRIDSYSVDISNAQATLGVQKATVMVRYLSTVEYFLVDFTGGQTVVIPQSLAQAA